MRIGITELSEGQDFYFFYIFFFKADNHSRLTRKDIPVELEYFLEIQGQKGLQEIF